MPRKNYTAQEVAKALAELRAIGTLAGASRNTGISRAALRAWSTGHLPIGVRLDPLLESQAAAEVAQKYREVESIYLKRLKDPTAVEKSNSSQAAIVVGIMSDKATRAEGGPTSRTEHVVVRYVEPNALRMIAARVIETTSVAIPPEESNA